jgi:hypothetical protein
MTHPEFSEDFIVQTQKMIADLRAELAPYEHGSAQARGGENDQWGTATLDRIAQIKLEIMALENSLARHGNNNA